MHTATPHNPLRRLSLLLLLLFALPAAFPGFASAQSGNEESCAGGTLYYIAFPDTTTNTWDSRFPATLLKTNTTAFVLYIYSPVDQTIEVQSTGGASERIELAGGEIYEFDTKDIGVPLVTTINRPQSNVLALRAQYPVIVYAYMLTAFGTEAFTPIAVEYWGKEHFAASWPAQRVNDVFPNGEFNYRAVAKDAEAELLVIAAYDSTVVEIETDTRLRDCAGCKTVTLKAGEAYLIQTPGDTLEEARNAPDLAGTYIRSSKPIGLISGNTRLMHNAGVRPSLAENSFKNMAIEWIPPVEQHGTEFVFTPTWDDRRQRDGLELEEARDVEVVRIYGTAVNADGEGIPTEVTWRDSLGQDYAAVTPIVIARDTQRLPFTHEKIGVPVARRFKTSEPAMAFSSPNSVVKFNGTTTWGANYVGASYLSWSTFMVELVPREQWTSFAPVRAPSLPSSMLHYLNLVADSAQQFNVFYRQGNSPRQLFPFNRGAVPGTDLVWGSIPLNKGVDYFIEGENGARFTGHAYGSYRGQEQYRPGTNRRKDSEGKESALSGGDGADEPGTLHPSEYEEDVALMYGYPLAPSRCVPADPGNISVQTETICGQMTIRVTVSGGEDTPGLRSIILDPDSTRNIRLTFVEPSDPNITGRRSATVIVQVIDPDKDADAVVVITDRSRDGEPIRIRYHYTTERLEFIPEDVLEFTGTRKDEAAGEKPVRILNPTDRPMTIRQLGFSWSNTPFRITRTEPAFDWDAWGDTVVLDPGDTMIVWIDVTPRDSGKTYDDSLTVQLNCTRIPFPVRAVPAAGPDFCLLVGDLDFGNVEVDKSRTLELELCNQGTGDITFNDPWVTWQGANFGITQADIERLKNTTLRAGECITITVIFSAGDTGSFSTTARFWANTRNCRDTSVWSVRVIEPSMGVVGEESLAGYGVTAVTPNPLTRDARIDFRLGRGGQTVVEVFDANGRRAALLADERMEAGENHVVWNADGHPAGAYHIRIRSGAWSAARPVILVR